MKKTKIILAALASLMASAVACDKDSTIGSSIVQDQISIVVDSSFTITGESVKIDSVPSRTISQLLGRINADGFGLLQSNIVTQFMPSSQIDTNITAIDSLVLYLNMVSGEFVGDSVAPMGLNVYRLTKNLPSPIYSNFNPEGYFDRSDLLASTIYNIANNSADTIVSGSVSIPVPLPRSLAHELFDNFKADPTNYLSPTAFAENVFKGVYIENSFGSGRLIRSNNTMMTIYFHHTYYDDEIEKDTTVYKSGNYFAVTPEIITNNDIRLEVSPAIIDRVENQKQQLVMAPVGYGVRLRFPAPEIIEKFRSSQADLTLLNTVSCFIPSEGISNQYNFQQPTYLLMVVEKEMGNFFANNKLPDNAVSFYAKYDSDTGGYDFGEMRAFIDNLVKKSTYDESDYTFMVVPVMATFETNSSSSYYYSSSSTPTLTMITPYMSSPVMSRLLLDQAKIKLTYSTQSIEK